MSLNRRGNRQFIAAVYHDKMRLLALERPEGGSRKTLIPDSVHGKNVMSTRYIAISLLRRRVMATALIPPLRCNQTFPGVIETAHVTVAVPILPQIDGTGLQN